MINLLGLLDMETARVWLFLQPLILVPAGIELSRISRAGQFAFFSVLWLLMASMKANMTFIGV